MRATGVPNKRSSPRSPVEQSKPAKHKDISNASLPEDLKVPRLKAGLRNLGSPPPPPDGPADAISPHDPADLLAQLLLQDIAPGNERELP